LREGKPSKRDRRKLDRLRSGAWDSARPVWDFRPDNEH